MASGSLSVILLARYFPPDNASGAQRARRMARYLPEFGYRPFVICGGEGPAGSTPGDTFYVPSDASRALAGRTLPALVGALQRRFPYDEHWPWALHAVRMAEKIIREHGVAALISTSPPVGTHYAAAWLARKYGLPWVADFRDPLYGSPGRWRRWMDLYDASLEHFLLERASGLVVVSDVVAAAWRRSYPQWSHKIELIWNGYDPAETIAARPIPQRGYQVLLHAGGLYRQRYAQPLLASLLRLIEAGRLSPGRIRVRLLGGIADRHLFHALPSVRALLERGVLDVREQTIPRHEALEELASSDVLLLLDVLDASGSGYTVPAKIFEYVQIGRPILALTGHDSPVDRILERGGVPCRVLYPEDAPAVVDSKVLDLLSLPATPAEPSAWFRRTFDGRLHAGQFAALLDRVCNSHRPSH